MALLGIALISSGIFMWVKPNKYEPNLKKQKHQIYLNMAMSLLLGFLAGIIEIFAMEKGDNPTDVLASINKKHKIDVGANFKIAVNDEFSQWNIKLNNGDRLVFIPPVTGG